MYKLEKLLIERFGIVFTDKVVLKTAFTHTSYANEHRTSNVSHNERLEFLGDAVLQLTISRYLYQKYPDMPEGDMSKLRSMIVREESLAGFARQCGFDKHIKLGRGERKAGGNNRPAILGDLFEAFLGALLLDKGVSAVEDFIYLVMIPQVEIGNYDRVKDYKTMLQELLQVNGDISINYRVVNETGPAHDKTFEIEVFADGEKLSQGKGKSKKLAEQEAAKNALKLLQES